MSNVMKAQAVGIVLLLASGGGATEVAPASRAEAAAERAEAAATRSEDAARRVEEAAARLERLVERLEERQTPHQGAAHGR
jgi:hypothetical protein